MYININKIFIITSLILNTTTYTQIKNIIFDLDGVLFTTNKFIFSWQIGPARLINYCAHKQNPLHIPARFYAFLNDIEPTTPFQYIPTDPQGNQIPQIMIEWFTGKRSSWEILSVIDENLKKELPGYSRTELYLFKGIAQAIFNPNFYIHTKRPLQASIRFAKKCKRKGYKLFILSNWDTISFHALRAQYQPFFALFDDIIISANVGLAKPNPAIYEYVLLHYQLDPAECLFIDDQANNVYMAQQCGIHAIHFIPGCYTQISSFLKA